MENSVLNVIINRPKIDRLLGSLFDKHRKDKDEPFTDTLINIMLDEEDRKVYYKIMIHCIAIKEYQDGNYTSSGMSYCLNKKTEDVVEKYGGTVWLPLH